MSNMIKAYAVRYDEEIKKTIDSHLRIDKDIEERQLHVLKAIETKDHFIEGLQAVIVETLPSQEEVSEKSAQLIEDAKNEAKHILEQARLEAEQMKKDIIAASQKKGYDNGILQAKQDALKLKTEYEEKDRNLRQEYETMAHALEPQVAGIIASLVEKITGIVVEDKEEVILYLVSKALKNMDKSDEYTIRVSKDDYEFISIRKNLLLGAIGREVKLYISEDLNLNKNQCLIETELHAINCSLDIQMNNLIMDLKLIGGI